MKPYALILLALVLFVTPAMANPPALSAIQAAQIAQEDLEMRGLQDRIYIEQIVFKKGRLGGEDIWEVVWNDDFPAQTEGRKEYMLKISMDGSYKRAVK